jgi:phage repressor protein C with HTH and peptisase S24 domain
MKLFDEMHKEGMDIDAEAMDDSIDAPPPWQNDPRWQRAQHALKIVTENNAEASALKERLETLINMVEVEVARFGFELRGDLPPPELMTDGQIALIRKRQEIQIMFEEIGEMRSRQERLPYIDAAKKVDYTVVTILRDKFTELLAEFGDEAAIQVVTAKALEHAVDAFDDDEVEKFIKQGAAERKKVADSRVTPAPPPANAAQTNVKDLPQYGQARAGRDGFHLPAGAEAMSHIARPFFLEGVGSAYAVYANGDSMEPRFRHGELLFIDPSRPPKRGDDVVVQVAVDDEICGFVKRFVSASDETTILHQFNPDQDISHPTPDVKAIHLVVGSLAAGR